MQNAVQYAQIEGIQLDSGLSLNNIQVAYHVFGNPDLSNGSVIWVFHALTGSSNVSEWWPKTLEYLLQTFPTSSILCVNTLGSCYGTSGPQSNQWWDLTVKDQVRVFELFAQQRGIQSVQLALGGSLGGQQLAQWMVNQPDFFDAVYLIACNGEHSSFGQAYNESQRMAIESDASQGRKKGLAAARSIAMLSYRTREIYQAKDFQGAQYKLDRNAQSYQRYQGQKLAERFQAESYYALTKAMDSQYIWDQPIQEENAPPALILALSTDQLFPVEDQVKLWEWLPDASFCEVETHFGHDAFLAEEEKIIKPLNTWLKGILKTKKNLEHAA